MNSDQALFDAFAELEDLAPRASGAEIRTLARERRRDRTVRWFAAAAAVILLGGGTAAIWGLVGGGDGPLGPGTWKGGDDWGSVELRYAVEGEEGLVGIDAPAIAPDQRVVFQVATETGGYLCLEEARDDGWSRIHPAPGEAWPVEAGRHWIGGDEPLSYRTDEGPGRREVRVLLDRASADCSLPAAEDRVVIEWEEETP